MLCHQTRFRELPLCMVAVAFLWAPSVVRAQDGVLPQQLAEVARELKCAPVERFYDRPGMVLPPYLYGVVGEPQDESAVFWCQRPRSRTFLLVAWRANHAPSHLEWTNFPGGLAITAPRDWNLSEFREVGAASARGPSVVLRGRRAIHSYYDGLSEYFIEHNGRWYVMMVD